MLKEQEARRATNPSAPSSEQTTRAIEDRIEHLRKQAPTERQTSYATAIRSTEGETGETAHKAAEVYARIPFYIPGTNEIGEFYVEPRVTDKGEMTFQFRFTDPDSAAEKIRLQVDLSPAEIAEIQTGLVRIQRWAETARHNKLRKFFEKRAGYVQQNPWLTIANKQLELMHKFMSEIGLSPVSRSRVDVRPNRGPSKFAGLLGNRPWRPADEYLGR